MPWVFCYRAEDELRELDLGEQREKRRSADFLANMTCGLA